MTTRFCAATRDLSRNIDEPFNRPLDIGVWRVLRLAKGIDHNEGQVREWYLSVKIRELGGKTAQELVQTGEADLVIRFLTSISHGYRD